MSSASVGGARLPSPPPAGRLSEDPLADAFAAAPATIIDPRPAIGGVWRPAGPDEEGLRSSDTPTRESKDVVQALAAHEFSIAQARQDAPPDEKTPAALAVEWDLSCVDDLSPPEPVEDFEDCLPTRIKTPPPSLPPLPSLPAPRFVRSSMTVIPRELLPPWPPPAPRRTAARGDERGAIWRVLLVSGVLVTMGLVVLYLRSASLVSLEGPASVEAAPRAAAAVLVDPPTVVFEPPPAAAAPAPAPVVATEVPAPKRPSVRKRRPAHASARGAQAEVAPIADPEPPPAGDQPRPNPF